MQTIKKQIVVDGGHEYDGFRMRNALCLGPTGSPTAYNAQVPAMMIITHSHDDHFSGAERLIARTELRSGAAKIPLIKIGSDFALVCDSLLLCMHACSLSVHCTL